MRRYNPPHVDVMRLVVGQPSPETMIENQNGAFVQWKDVEAQLTEAARLIKNLGCNEPNCMYPDCLKAQAWLKQWKG